MRVFTKELNGSLFKKVKLDCYIINNSEEYDEHRKREAIIICPGGAYAFRSDREGEPVAIKMLSLGFQAFVLNYSVKPATFPTSLTELAEVVKYVRKNAEKLFIDPDKIVVCGFSAGGHLAASLGVYWNSQLLSSLGLDPESIKPNALLLSYGVLSAGKYSHKESIKNLLGPKAESKSELEKVDLVNLVNDKVPPTYLWHTATDPLVPCENSLLFALELKKNRIPFRLNIFPKGTHGLSLGSLETEVEDGKMFHKWPVGKTYQPEIIGWPEDFARWTKLVLKND